jgi:hypothetical protein
MSKPQKKSRRVTKAEARRQQAQRLAELKAYIASLPKPRKSRRGFRVGDRVRFLGYRTALSWGDRKPQKYGFIVNINGGYILVRPRWWKQDQLIERYPNEIALAINR